MKRAIPILAAMGTLAALAALWATSCSLDVRYDKYAIVFGVADYPGTANDLSFTDDDANAMAALLTAQGFTVYERTDANATRAELESLLGAIAASATQEDLFVFYFSGHGGQAFGPDGVSNETSPGADAPDEWIFLHGSLEYTWTGPGPTDGTYSLDFSETYSDDGLAAALRVLPCAKKIVILDACNSGGFIADRADVDGVPPTYSGTIYLALGKLDSALSAYFNPAPDSDIGPGDALVLAASGEREYSYESASYQHGVFTYFLLQAPGEADRNADGFVTVIEAYNYVFREIDRNWNAQVLSTYEFAPHASGGPLDFVLFTAP